MRRMLATLFVLFAVPAFAVGLLEKNHPLVDAGMKAWEEQRYEDALAAFEAAKREVKGSPTIDFNIGNALYKLGRYEEATQAWQRAADADDGKGTHLKQRDYYNIGNAFAQMNQKKDAIAAYRKALRLDPTDEMARHNLEVMLRDLPPKESPPTPGDGGQDAGTDGGSDGGTPDGGQDGGSRDAGSDGGSDGGSDAGTSDGGTPDAGGSDGGSDAGTSDGGSADGGSPDGGGPDGGADGGTSDGGQPHPADAGQPDGGTPDGGSNDSGGKGQDGGTDGGTDGGSEGGRAEAELTDGGTEQELSQQDVEKLLDSMKQNEKNLQLWRFQQQKPRKPNAKDW